MEGQQGLLATWRHHCSRSHMLQPFLFLCLVMTARMLASVAAVIASSCVRMMNCSSTGNSERWLPGGAAGPPPAFSAAQSDAAGAAPAALRRAPAPRARRLKRTGSLVPCTCRDRSRTMRGQPLQEGGGSGRLAVGVAAAAHLGAPPANTD